MTSESFAPKEVVFRPTSLVDLFAFRGLQFQVMKLRLGSAGDLKRDFRNAQATYDSLSEEVGKREQNLSENRRELSQQITELQSSRNCSVAYLAMVDELSEIGVAPAQILDFFKMCLVINTGFFKQFSQKLKGDDNQLMLMKGLAYKERTGPFLMKGILSNKLENPPEWFKKSKKEWQEFLLGHALFVNYLNSSIIRRFEGTGAFSIEEIENAGNLSATLESGYPDWLTENNGQLPDREVVEQELTEDSEELNRLNDQINHSVAQSGYLRQKASQKFMRAAAWVEQRKRETFPKVESFTDVILFLEATSGMTEYSIDPSKIRMIEDPDQLKKFRISPETLFERTVKNFANSEGGVCRETLALWIERRLRENGLTEAGNGNVSEKIMSNFDSLFEEIENGGENEDFRSLKTQDKKAFSFLNYEMKPLLAMLNSSERLYLQELVHELAGSSMEPVIWEISGLVTPGLRALRGIKEGNIKKVSESIKKFTENWIRSNWRWVYNKLSESLLRAPAELPVKFKIEEVVEEEIAPQEVIDLELALLEVQQGHLLGWRLFYTLDMSVEEDLLIDIGGMSLKEREERFGKFLASHDISCSIKPASVIRALEWITIMPQAIERTRYRKTVGEEIFRKIKRGRVRILYQLFPEDKKIIFFIHQKKAWSYGF